jgi:hydrogenase maturation protein HypF
MSTPARSRVEIEAIFQGVGFHPVVYGLAAPLGLPGWVRNRSGEVQVEAEGSAWALEPAA